MNSNLGWSLAAIGVVAGWWAYGWQGVVMAASLTAFWLLLQFSRVLRAVKNAGQAPMGHVPSAVMLHSRLKTGMTLMQLIGLTRSLGRRVSETPEAWAWADDGACEVTAVFDAKGRLASWTLKRPDASPGEPVAPAVPEADRASL
jgi:hypothetical protein